MIMVNVPFIAAEQTLLACLPKNITPLQSCFSGKSIDTLVDKEFQKLRANTSDCFSNHCMAASDQRTKDFFNERRSTFYHLHSLLVSVKLLARAKREN